MGLHTESLALSSRDLRLIHEALQDKAAKVQALQSEKAAGPYWELAGRVLHEEGKAKRREAR